MSKKLPHRSNWLFFFLFLIALPFRFYHLTYPLLDAHYFRQTQTATIALNFYKERVNFFQTELDIFGIGKEKCLTLEFPLYESIVAVMYKIFFFDDLWGRVISITFAFVGAWYLYKLVLLLISNNKIALFSTFFFLFTPLNMFYHRSFMIEPTVITLLLAGVYYFCHWVNFEDKKSYLLSTLFLILGFIHKGIYGLFWFLPMIVYYLKKRSFREIFSTKSVLIFLIPLIVLFFWQKHVDNINTVNGHEYFTSYNKGHLEWNFGNIADRYSLVLWKSYFQQILNGIFLKPGLPLFLIGLLVIPKIAESGFLLSWFLSQIIYFILFFKIQSHNYYQMVMVPVFSVFMSAGLVKIADWIDRYTVLQIFKMGRFNFPKSYINIVFITFFCTIFIYKSWINTLPSFHIDWNLYERLKTVGRILPENAYGILVTPGYDWNSVYTYYTKRKMLTVSAEEVTKEKIERWRNSGYSFIMLYDYRAYPKFLEKVKPGHNLDFLGSFNNILTSESLKILLLK